MSAVIKDIAIGDRFEAIGPERWHVRVVGFTRHHQCRCVLHGDPFQLEFDVPPHVLRTSYRRMATTNA